MSKIAVYPGSFDPFSYGHLSILGQAVTLFDEIHIIVAKNPDKKSLFTSNQRIEIIKAYLNDIEFQYVKCDIKIVEFGGLIVDYVAKVSAQAIIRGLRNSDDLSYESQLLEYNNTVSKNTITTIFLMPEPKYLNMSSTLLRNFIATDKLHLADVRDKFNFQALQLIKKYIRSSEETKQ